jgi:hypothetical protein
MKHPRVTKYPDSWIPILFEGEREVVGWITRIGGEDVVIQWTKHYPGAWKLTAARAKSR